MTTSYTQYNSRKRAKIGTDWNAIMVPNPPKKFTTEKPLCEWATPVLVEDHIQPMGHMLDMHMI